MDSKNLESKKNSSFKASSVDGNIRVPVTADLKFLQGIDYNTFNPKSFPFGPNYSIKRKTETHTGVTNFTSIDSASEFAEAMAAEARLNFSGFGKEAGMRMGVELSNQFKEQATYLIGSHNIEHGEEEVEDWEFLKFTDYARELIKTENFERFKDIYGTHCVVNAKLGGYIVIEGKLKLRSVDQSSQILAEITASWKNFINAEAKFKADITSHANELSISFGAKYKGMLSDHIVPIELDKIKEEIQNFPVNSKGEKLYLLAVPYSSFPEYHIHRPTPPSPNMDPLIFQIICKISFIRTWFSNRFTLHEKEYLMKKGVYDRFRHYEILLNEKPVEELEKQISELEKGLVNLEISIASSLDEFRHSNPKEVYRIRNKMTGKYICIYNDYPPTVGQSSYQNVDNQKFVFKTSEQGYFIIQGLGSNLVLDVEGLSQDDKARVIPFEYNKGDNQHWTLDVAPGRVPIVFTIKNVHSQKVLDIDNGNNDDHAEVIQFPLYYNPNQLFFLESVKDPTLEGKQANLMEANVKSVMTKPTAKLKEQAVEIVEGHIKEQNISLGSYEEKDVLFPMKSNRD